MPISRKLLMTYRRYQLERSNQIIGARQIISENKISDVSTRTAENGIWDIAKLIMAFFIVEIHVDVCSFNQSLNFYVSEWLARFAVPMFFCLAGYFLFKKMQGVRLLSDANDAIVRKYILRILYMYVFWTLFYLIFQIFGWIENGVTIRDLLIYLEYTLVRGDSYLHLWYLGSLLCGVFCLWVLNRLVPRKIVFLIAFSLFIIGLFLLPYRRIVDGFIDNVTVLSTLRTLFNRFIGTPRNGPFFGFVFITMGALIADKNFGKKRILAVDLAASVFFIILSFVEVTMIRRINIGTTTYYALQASMLPATYFLFHVINSIKIKSRPVYKKLRKCSTLIYCIHPAIIFIVDCICKNSTIKAFFDLPFAKWFVVYAVSFAISFLIVSLEKNGHLKRFKMFH